MRTSVIAPFGIAALALGVWYTTNRSENFGPVPDRSVSHVAPVVVPSEDDSAAVRQGAPPTAPSEDRAASDEREIVAAGPAIRASYREPVFRDVLVRYLVDRGLSALDSGHIVNAAIDDLSECMTSADFDPEGRATTVCNQNVLQRAGLDEAILKTAVLAAGRSMARRRVLEGPRGWEIGVALSLQQRTN